MRDLRLDIAIATVLVLLLGLGVFWLTTWRYYVPVGTAEHLVQITPFRYPGVVGRPTATCHHAKGGFLGLSRVDDCIATYASGAAYHCRVWNPYQGVGDELKCNQTPFHKGTGAPS